MNRDPTAEHDAENSDASDAVTRRRALAAGGAVGLASLAGCTAFEVATGEGPAEFAAGTATVADATLSESGYELNEVSEETLSREVEAAGQTREVRVTNTVAEYDKAVELFGERYQAAVFAAVTTPQIEVLGEALNPIAEFSTRERAELILSRFEGVGDLERGSEYSTEVLGSDAGVVVYTADAEIEGTGVTTELELHIGEPVGVGSDFVLPLAAYPSAFSDGENVRRMMNGIEHEPNEEN
ncbi:hypothetical protein DVK05_00295 [Halorubrum sp. Atlit-8R]|uniref:DUF6517 family protein n=1 Tax=unclassified Halorubrum TaxID=2642239 RepID=UPI000EF2720F|nr:MULTISPECIES: DUF6517 family protein [unclassified Halorubrum]RLM71572.1 hypothetical protein DVK08_05470 [Halorubrum sp. Atlit-9R]RLM82274.1 hypothetical protein DVK05_00295 [Halorubrum sp. Atlit-8R]TKX57162.1 hypothetical protein EXE44_11210 [Halorubrum sp. SS7]